MSESVPQPDSHADLEVRIEQIKQALKGEPRPQERERLINALCDAALALAKQQRIPVE